MSENNIILESCLKLEPEPEPEPETKPETEPRNVYDDEISRLKKLISLNPIVPVNPYYTCCCCCFNFTCPQKDTDDCRMICCSCSMICKDCCEDCCKRDTNIYCFYYSNNSNNNSSNCDICVMCQPGGSCERLGNCLADCLEMFVCDCDCNDCACDCDCDN
jgi:hypothetical protein